MAKIGVKHFVAAEVENQVYGEMPTYKKGFEVGRLIQIESNPSYNDNPLYANNGVVNDDKSLSTYPVTIGVDEFGDGTKQTHAQVEALMTGGKLVTKGENQHVEYGSSPTVHRLGVGYIIDGKYPKNAAGEEIPYFEANVLYQVDFAGKPQSTASTRAGSISWGTETLSGNVREVEGLPADANLEMKKRFDEEKDAIDFIDEFFGLKEDTSGD